MNQCSPADQAVGNSDIRSAVWDAIGAISTADEPGKACSSIAGFASLQDGELLSIKIVERGAEHNSVRPWSNYSDGIRALSNDFQEIGGCFFHREAMSRLRPFLLSEIPRQQYESLLERRLLSEIDKLSFKDIFAIPVVLGRGVAQVLIGQKTVMDAEHRRAVSDMMGHMIAALLVRFPELGRAFDQKRLSGIEAHVLGMISQGCTAAEVSASTGLSEITQNHLLERARAKLGARNRYELVRLATLLGEFDGRGERLAGKADKERPVQPEFGN
jgi:DNA-binding CsgD family transcriptional regulator